MVFSPGEGFPERLFPSETPFLPKHSGKEGMFFFPLLMHLFEGDISPPFVMC